ncbi:carbamate kinase [Liberiplasma polymorphum]|uniref:carbamate kinase n=1 Tax=Liberiplasma polymorphum TaxID=3374570 RepID=UPI0037768CE1
MSRYVVSLGGNALGNNADEQKSLLKNVAKPIVQLIKEGHEVVIVHGNGPQVGMINLAFNESKSTPDMPFPECGAMSQGYIGFHLQNAIHNELVKQSIKKNIAALITQVLVDENDPLFLNPSKPIGAFYSKEEADAITNTEGYVMKEDSGRGFRRVVPSPLPVDVIEKEMIQSLLKDQHVVICSGGGGIPVIEKNYELVGIAAVIDKDYASAKIAELINADYLVILTAVDYVFVNFNKPNQKALGKITINELTPYLHTDEFAKGSMFPKVQACLKFLENNNKTAIISSIENAVEAFRLNSGTIITH